MRNLHSIFMTITIVISSLLIISNYLTIRTTSAIRGYINGESYYSKGNKDASKDLILYIQSEDESYYQSFLENIKIPVGDSIARVAMESNGSLDVIKKGLIQGNNHPDDLDNLIWLFQNFRRVIFMKNAIQVWEEADVMVGNLYEEGQSFHIRIKTRSLSDEEKKTIIAKVNAMSLALAEKGIEFAAVLGDSSRKISALLFYVNVVLIFLIVGGVGRYAFIFIKKLSSSNELRNQIMNSSFDAIIWYNTNSEIVFWNPQAKNVFGWKKEEILGNLLTETIIPTRFHDLHRGTIKHYLDSKEKATPKNGVETVAMNKSGVELPIELTIIPIFQNNDALFCAHVRDITKSKEMENDLRDRETLLRGILESTNHGILATDQNGRTITSNKRFFEIWDVPSELALKNNLKVIFDHALDQLIDADGFLQKIHHLSESDQIDIDLLKFKNGKSIYRFSSPLILNDEIVASIARIGETLYVDQEDRTKAKQILKKDGQVLNFEFRSRKKSGGVIWVRNHVRMIYDENGKPLHIEGSIEDITDRKLAEAKLLTQLEEVKKVNYELDKFVYSVSHDLRAPLASILGIVNVAEAEKPSQVQEEYLGLIKGSVNRLDLFIRDILDYSRNSRVKIKIVEIDFHQIASESKLNLNFMEGFGRITFNIDIDVKETFYSDKRSIEVILNNLISNSIKYQDYKKESSFISISIKSVDKNVVIEFSDNGIGIEQDYIDKVFDMFFRASKEFSGAGLGLYILKETVAKLKGTVKLESKPGQFAKFEITLPELEDQRSKLFID